MPLSKALFTSVPSAATLISGEPHVSRGLQEDLTGSMGDSTSPWSSTYDFSSNSYNDQGFQLPLNLYSCIASDEFQNTAQGHSGSETMWATHQPMSYSSLDADPSCPRSFPTLDVEAIAAAFPPSYFHVDPQNFQSTSDSSDQQHPANILRADADSHLGSNYCFGNDSTSNTHPAPSQRLSTQHTEVTTDSNLTPPYENDEENADDPIEDLHLEDTKMSDQPYAILIWHALRAAPNHTMVLKDIYHWFTQNTDKGKDKSKDNATGWQNSVRHNLSMNAAFVKIPQLPGEESKKGCTWQLAPQFVDVPPKSTTRYRNKDPNKRTPKSLNPAPQRQVSGAKGGQAAKNTVSEIDTALVEPAVHGLAFADRAR
ncbi:hypothetical protein LTR04_003102 [Oleoguttula sp. CCFEE 6159]|nr:hypothetical protein LTR04_003102 [Oleoguttula sp. CCFEE 6159]